MQDEHTAEELSFHCQRWLSREEDDGEICRELSAVKNGVSALPSEMISIVKYYHKNQSNLVKGGIAVPSLPNSTFVFNWWQHLTDDLDAFCNCMF